MKEHHYETQLRWVGSTGAGYRNYDRAHDVTVAGNSIRMSADPSFLGDSSLPNPEQLLLAAASSCQMLSFLALAAIANIDVVAYEDAAQAVMPEGSGKTRITQIDLHLQVTVRGTEESTVLRLLEQAHEQCYISNSLNGRVDLHAAVTVVA